MISFLFRFPVVFEQKILVTTSHNVVGISGIGSVVNPAEVSRFFGCNY